MSLRRRLPTRRGWLQVCAGGLLHYLLDGYRHMEARTSIEVVRCSSLEEFVAKVRPQRFIMPRLFRGQHRVDWKLQEMFDRWLAGRWLDSGPHNFDKLFSKARQGRFELARLQLDSFRRLVEGLPGVEGRLLEDDRQLWALGRHHGLVTPLLDWSESPYVAAFFAFFDRLAADHPGFRHGSRFVGAITLSDAPVAVWELHYDDSVVAAREFEVFTFRRSVAARQKAQAGVFTILTHASILDLAEYYVHREKTALVRRYEISGTECLKALASLRQMNITCGSLFPDLDGAAIEANIATLMNAFTFGE